jgi:hypothetical protein
MDAKHQCASSAVLEIALLPLLAWVYALLLHWEIRSLAKTGVDLPPNSRLRQLHQSLVLAVLLLSFMMIEGLRLTCHGLSA